MRRTQTSSMSTSATSATRSTGPTTNTASRLCAAWAIGSWQGPTTLLLALRRAIWDDDPDVCSTVGPVRRVGIAAVGPGDRTHDRESESRSAPGASRVRASEALKRVCLEPIWEAWAGVLRMYLGALLGCRGPQRHIHRPVADCVIDQATERLLETLRIAEQPHVIRNRHRDRRMLRIEAVTQPVQHLEDFDLHAADRKPGFVRAREHEQVIRQIREPVDLVVDRDKRVAELVRGALATKRELELCLERGKRCAKLMAGVGHKCLLAGKRLLQSVEHLVERGPEPPDLVISSRQRQPPPRLGCRHRATPAA